MAWFGSWAGGWFGSWFGDGAVAAAAPGCIKTRRFSILGVSLSSEIAKGFKGKLVAATLIRVCAGERTAGNLAGGTNAETHTFTADGFVETYNEAHVLGSLVKSSARKVVLIAGSIKGEGYTWVVPEQGDRVTIEEVTYAVGPVESDPAGATYTLHGAKA